MSEATKPMDPHIKQEWLAALRSGDYTQARRTLRKYNNFCCLGVLCDLVDNSRWTDVSDSGDYLYNAEYGQEFGIPPLDIMEKAQLPDAKCVYLAKLNDDGMSFEKLADYIEEHL